jgi:hypothetical protein
MAVLCVVMTIPDQTISDLNGKAQFPTKTNETLSGIANYISALEAGTLQCNVQVTCRDTAPSISTSGSGSTQNTYTK